MVKNKNNNSFIYNTKFVDNKKDFVTWLLVIYKNKKDE